MRRFAKEQNYPLSCAVSRQDSLSARWLPSPPAPHELQNIYTCLHIKTLAPHSRTAVMNASPDETQALRVFRAQYFQLLDPTQMRWPEAEFLKRAEVQAWLFEEMFDRDSIQYPPPERYQVRVLKQLVSVIENAIDDPEEDVRSPSSPLFPHRQFFLSLSPWAPHREARCAQRRACPFLLFQGEDRSTRIVSWSAVSARGPRAPQQTYEPGLTYERDGLSDHFA